MKKSAHFLLLLLPLLGSCEQKPKINWNVTLDHEQKDPYGTWLAYQSLPHYFPQAKRELISRSFRYTSIDDGMLNHNEDSVGLLVMTGLNYYISENEWGKIKQFAQTGNEVLIISSRLDNKIEASLRMQKTAGMEELALDMYNDGTTNQSMLSLLPDTTKHYGHTGRSLEGYFTLGNAALRDTLKAAADSTATSMEEYAAVDDESTSGPEIGPAEVLGYTRSHPGFVRYAVGNGHITLHAAPLVFSNYFLLQDGNRAYLDGIWHAFPDNISHIYWNEYFKRSTEGSSMNVLWRYPATRWALIIAIATLLIYVLFGLKRRQRIIPIVRPLKNASVSFIETIGRLYFNKGNHANLAEKMIQHFLEWVRTYYYLDTAQLNDTFISQLAAKSGKHQEGIRSLVNQIHDIRIGAVVTPEYLYKLHNTLQSFYNHQRI